MASSPRRGMDWPTAWRASLLVYGLAVLLQAFFPLFAIPAWTVFIWDGFRVLGGARLAKDPWQGRVSPRIYLIAFAPLLILSLVTFAQLVSTPADQPTPQGTLLVYSMSLVFALGLAAVFMTASAPATTRERRGLLALAVLAELGSAAVQSGLTGLVALPNPFAILGLALGLSAGSFLLLLFADRIARTRTTLVAHRAPRA